jgi:hypothetical protein
LDAQKEPRKRKLIINKELELGDQQGDHG